MDIGALSSITGFTANSKLMAAAICLAAVFVAWYTVRTRIQMSQVIFGVFAFVLVMIFGDLINNIINGTLTEINSLQGTEYAVYSVISLVLSREVIRFLATRYVLGARFQDTDAAIGFGLGFGAVYVIICGISYFFDYTTVNAFLTAGSEAFFAEFMNDAEREAAYESLVAITQMDGWQNLMLAVNRVFYLVREMALCVLLWYGFYNAKMRRCLILVPVLSIIAWIPDSLFGAGMIVNSYVKDVLDFAISGAIAGLASVVYNKNEDQVAHFRVERLYARRRK